VESRHRVHVAVADPDGRLVASAGEPDLVTHFRSAAKPLQALPLVEDGAGEAFGIPGEELALICASHSGEEAHVEGVRSLLRRAGVPEAALELGPHLPLWEDAAHDLIRAGLEAGPIHNNCSGKHAGMLALARHRGWSLEGYRLPDHPVQRRMLEEVSRWTGLDPEAIRPGVDGCGVVCFGLPLSAMARSFAALGSAAVRGERGPAAVVSAMVSHPYLLAGTGRLCTRLIEATDGVVFAKVGAEGVYCAGDRDGTLGVAVKVEDGSRRAVEMALIRVLEQTGLLAGEGLERLAGYRRRTVPNSRGDDAAFLEAELDLSGSGRTVSVGRRFERAADRGASDRGPGSGVGPLDSGPAVGLGPGVRSLVRASGAVATRDRDTILEALDQGSMHADPRDMEEVLVQAYLFVGFPGALNALALWREVQARGSGHDAGGADGDVRVDSPSREDLPPDEQEERGEEICRRVYGERYEDLRSNIRRLSPDLDRWMIREGYGKVLGRPGLDLAVRELCIVGLLAVLDAPVQLYSHLRGALGVGADSVEVEEALWAVDDLMDPEARARAWDRWRAVQTRRSGAGEGEEG